MKLLWKIKLDNQTRQMHSLFPPLIVGSATTSAGPKQIAVVAGVSDNLFGIDVEKGTLLWKRHFDSTYQEPPPVAGGRGGSVLCPGGLTATPVIAPTETPGKYVAYAVSWDGRLRKLDVATGEEIEPPALFLPPNGKPYGLNLVNGVIYTTTAQGCGGNPNHFYSYDLATKKVGYYNPGSGGLWPRSGPSVGKDGTVYAGSGDGDYYPEQQIYGQAIIGVKQNPQTKALELKDWYAPFERLLDAQARPRHERDRAHLRLQGQGIPRAVEQGMPAVAARHRHARRRGPSHAGLPHAAHLQRRSQLHDGRLGRARDVGGLGGHALGADAVLGPEASAVQGADRARPGRARRGRGVQGRRARGQGAARAGLDLPRHVHGGSAGHRQRDRVRATAAARARRSAGPSRARPGGAAGRIEESTHAVLYALDGQTGKELWSSGDQIASWNHFSGLSVANGRVYIGTFDGMLYCFGAASLAERASPRRRRHGDERPVPARTYRVMARRWRPPWRRRLLAQGRGGAEWTTSGGDAQRSSWIRSDPRISVGEHGKGAKASGRSSSCGS